jgi:hypothetical protein
LIEIARRDITPRPRRRLWVPAVAAVAPVAALVAATVIAPDPIDRPQPSTGSPSATPSPGYPSSTVVDLDLRAATTAEARLGVKRCLAPDDMLGFTRADGEQATVHWARWLKRPASYVGTAWRPGGTHLVLNFTMANRRYAGICTYLPELGLSYGPLALAGAWSSAVSDPGSLEAAVSRGSAGRIKPGAPWVATKEWDFTASPRVGRVEARIVWPGHATPWYTGHVQSGRAFVEATAIDSRGAPTAAAKAQIRAFDAAGEQIGSWTEPVQS